MATVQLSAETYAHLRAPRNGAHARIRKIGNRIGEARTRGERQIGAHRGDEEIQFALMEFNKRWMIEVIGQLPGWP